MKTSVIEYKLNALPDDLKKEVLNFIDFLLAKRKKEKTAPSRQFDFAWEGGLANLKDTYSSVELQHKATEWR
ncbi:MAG: DUF2281 domain-containing protein [Candidatus Electrothrix sp. LOE2]|nr:DUF2281 domain-containing protein [Candidatus Electrothrix sp. LOE2]